MIVYCKHIMHAHTHTRTHARMHAHTHARMHARTYTPTHWHAPSHPPTTIAVQVVTVRWVGAPNHDEVNAPFRPFRWWWMAGHCFVQINSRVCVAVFAIVLGVFRVRENSRTNFLERELMTGCAFSRYEQFETSPETIDQELRSAVCQHRQTGLRRV